VRESEFTDLARGLIALGQSGEAMPLLERLLDGAQSMGRQDDAARYLVLLALAFRARGDTPSALETLSQALMLAESEGYVRLFVDEGEPMAELLREIASRGDDLDYVNLLLAAFGERTRDGGPPSMVEPLSERELEVLRLLATGLTYRQVAEQLIISLNTVRHHTRNIYGKLGVRSRTQAIARTQELGLL
jgi:LuxR family maltose regulon positive regulatory protein